jgi:hypothetical protein
MKTGTICGSVLVLLSLAMGCGSNQTPAGAPATAASGGGVAPATSAGAAGPGATSASPGPAASTPAATASAAPPAASAPPARAFASTALEAQSLIQEQIDSHMGPLLKCVNDFRGKKGDAHKAVVVDVGIDQEGNLLGVTTPNAKKGDLDPAMRDCMLTTLRGLPFPKSHAGIITVRQTFTDVVVNP